MRRILNLNEPGIILVKIIALFAVAIPGILYLVSLLLTEEQINNVLFRAMRVSFAFGIFLFIALLALIIAEQIQDHQIDVHYQKNRDQKVLLGDGNYECQYCGNRKVKEHDKICGVCGRELK
jgi:uncharacterized paraquat-inducible protein A